ncbi:MAG: calcium-binding protein, partial [Pseudomonadota bacterium]
MTTTPTTWLNNFQVNTSSTNFQGLQDIVGLSNGNFLVVFADDSGTVGTGSDRDIIGVIYNAQGDIVTTAFQVNTFGTADFEESPSIAATNDGGFVMAYEDRDTTSPTQQILVQRYDATGASIDSGFVQFEPSTEFVSSPKIAVNQADNSMFITYQWSDGNDDSIRGKRLDANLNAAPGTPADGYVLRADGFTSDSPGVFSPNTAVLSNGNFVTVFAEPDNATTGGENIEFRISDGTTGANGLLLQVSTSGGDEEITPDVAALTGGGFVVVWREVETATNGDDTGDNIQFARYSSTGALQGSIVTVVDTTNEYWDPAVIGLEDGGFFIAAYDATSDTIEGTRFDSSGVQVGANMAAYVTSITNFPDIELSLTTDGRILLTYDDPSGNVQVEILDPRDAGTITADPGDQQTTARATEDTTLIGVMNESDTLFGQDGDDVIYGGDITGPGAFDVLYGGDGNDYLDGGLFNDQSYGGSGNDTFNISVGNAADDVFGGTGIDTLDFTSSGLTGDVIFDGPGSGTYLGLSNTFSGIGVILGNDADRTWDLNFGTQSVVAGSGNDTFIHGDGEFVDDLDAGDGFDTFDASLETSGIGLNINNTTGLISGLNGPTTFLNFEYIIGTQLDDTIVGDGDDETLDGQDGNDLIVDGAGDDVIYGGDGNDTFDKTDGNDTWFGGAGNDTINGLNTSDTDSVDGGTGIDIFSVQGSGSQWTLANNIATSNFQETSLNSIEIFVGSNQADDIDEGNGAINEFFGGGGDDIIRTNGINVINETFIGGTGVDTLDYSDETGDTTFDMTTGSLTGAGAASLFENVIAGSGNDTITGTTGDNTIDGGAGADILNGNGGSDTYIVADDGSTNSINGSVSLDTIDLSGFTSGIFVGQNSSVNPTGDYNIVSGNGTVIENANLESKTLIASESNDIIHEFNLDVIYGGGGNDEVIVYQSTSSNEAYYGGSGLGDTLNLADGIDGFFDNDYGEVNLLTGVLGTSGGAFGFENAIGTEGDNTITGTGDGNFINGAGGNDTIEGGASGDSLDGGAGIDTLSYASSSVGVTVDLGAETASGGDAEGDAFANFENLIGSGMNDLLFGDAGSNHIQGGMGSDFLLGGAGADTLNGGDGLDWASYSDVTGPLTINVVNPLLSSIEFSEDTLISIELLEGSRTASNTYQGDASIFAFVGGLASDTINAGSGDNSISGLGGTDVIYAGLGDDEVYGGGDDDILFLQDGGTDSVDGGAGNDGIFFGAALTAADTVDGGAGDADQLALQGDYSGGLSFGANSTVGIEQVILLPGNITAFGAPGTEFYDYNFTLVDA